MVIEMIVIVKIIKILVFFLMLSLKIFSISGVASAEENSLPSSTLMERLTPDVIASVFQGIDSVAMIIDDGPVSAGAFKNNTLQGYIFSTLDVLRAPGYASTPFDVVAGVTLDGKITGAVILFHREPYLLNDRVRTQLLTIFLSSLEGADAKLGAFTDLPPTFVSGATISARAMRNAVQEGARMVLAYRNDQIVVSEPTIDIFNFKPQSISELVGKGGLVRSKISNAKLIEAISKAGYEDFLPEIPKTRNLDDVYIDLVVGFANPPIIGRNVAGLEAYDKLINQFPEGTSGIVLATIDGVYDHRGARFNNLSNDFKLDRITLKQGEKVFEFYKNNMLTADRFEADILVIPTSEMFDPMKKWTLILHAFVVQPDGKLLPFILDNLDYRISSNYILLPDQKFSASWMEPWFDEKFDIMVLTFSLTFLTVLLAAQSTLTKNRKFHKIFRLGFLSFTLIWIGWISSAQLSIVHILNYINAPFAGLNFGFYLMEPMIVLISLYTLLSVFIIGRGVFCGWLCPFGALQEILGSISKKLNFPKFDPKENLQKKLWLIKYFLLGIIVLLSLSDSEYSSIMQEIEPFKTAITAKFSRSWPYFLYAIIILMIGLFTERAFCRFLCPLGATLALFDRLHILNYLKRRPECGSPCHLCEKSCPVKAIQSDGKIIMDECFLCLDCMVEYNDDRRCPPLAIARKKSLKVPINQLGLKN